MIAVDSSAVIAILRDETPGAALLQRLGAAGGGVISTATVLELQLVLADDKALEWNKVERLFVLYRVAVRPFDDLQLTIAREAALRFGRGRHPARLNFGDCFAYALAKSEGIPLLYVGGDFAKTDIEAA